MVGDDESAEPEVCVFCSVFDVSTVSDRIFPGSNDSAVCLSAVDRASLTLLFEGNDDISRGVDEVWRSD